MASPLHADMVEALANLTPPDPALPPGAWDVHAHVFGPFDRFPLSEGALYPPPLAPYADYVAMLDRVGFAHGVLVHPGAHGFDNSAMLDALQRAQGRLRGVAVVPPDIEDSKLADMHAAGVRGVRFTAMPMGKPAGVLDLQDLQQFGPRLKELGWHAQVWSPAAAIEENEALLRSIGVPLVFDHMAQFDLAGGPEGPGFRTVLKLTRDGAAWVKMTAFRNSKEYPVMDDVRPFHAALVQAAPDQLLWGSDWPFIGMGDRMPQMPRLLSQLREWTADETVVRKILVTNPARLYGQ